MHKATFWSISSLNLRRLYLEAYTLGLSKLLTSEFEPWILISQSFILPRPWEIQKFQAHKLVLFGARMRFSRSKHKLIKNDF